MGRQVKDVGKSGVGMGLSADRVRSSQLSKCKSWEIKIPRALYIW